MRKALIGIAAALAVGLAFAGLDTYSKQYTTILTPSLCGPTTPITNSVVTGVDLAGRPGKAALVLFYKVNNYPTANTVVRFYTSTSSNGTYSVATINGASAWYLTNTTGYTVLPITPNAYGRWMRCVVTPSATATNATVGALLVTE